jgi:uncharacterized protein involved in response to NO
MVFGFGMAAVAGFLLTAIPNWTGRLPLRGLPLALLALLWLAGRVAMLVPGAALLDLAFPATLIVVVARELLAGRNWRNLPMLAALALLFAGNLLFHLGVYAGLRLGHRHAVHADRAGGRAHRAELHAQLAGEGAAARAAARPRERPGPGGAAGHACRARRLGPATSPPGRRSSPDSRSPCAVALARPEHAARAAALRPARRLRMARRGLILLGLAPAIPASAALHALTGRRGRHHDARVMTRATLGHTGRALVADHATVAIYLLVTLAALLRLLSPLFGSHATLVVSLAGIAWSAAFATFAVHYGSFLTGARPSHEKTA